MDGYAAEELNGKRTRNSHLRSSSTPRSVWRNSFLCILGICLLALDGLANAGTYTLVSPQNFIRPSGASVAESSSFSARDPNGTYTVNVYNGGLEGNQLSGEAVSSSVISLNGIQIFGPNEFNQKVSTLSKAVSLQNINELTVQLWGKPGGVITLEIIGEDSVVPTITASVNPVSNSAGWHKSDVVVSFQCDDVTSGIATCPEPTTVTAEGAAQVISGTAVDNAGNQASTSVTINLDLTAPIIQITSPLAGAVLSERRPTILLFVTDNFGLDLNSLVPSVNSVTFDGVCSSESSTAACIPNNDLPRGDIVLVANVSDQAGNTGTNEINFRIETDLDGDGIDDNIDQCSSTPTGETVDASGCAASQLDSDNDGINDDLDLCANTQIGTIVDITGCPIVVGDDTDGDTIGDAIDNCPTIFNLDQADSDSDGTGDACEIVGTITITSPTQGQIIDTATISVAGILTGPAGSGVAVNGRQACVYNDQFVINNISVNTGDHAIAAQINPPIGIGESAQVTVNRNGESLYTVEPNTNCAVAPFDARFTLDRLETSINQIDIDYDSDGLVDASITDLTNPVFEHTYINPGTYQVNIVGFDNLGNLHNQSLGIIVQDGAAIDAVIQAGWQNITAGLSANNITQALNELTPSAQEKYAPVFSALQGNLPAIMASFSALQVVDINVDYAEYAINRTIDGVDRVFLIYFVRDGNGSWKLDSM